MKRKSGFLGVILFLLVACIVAFSAPAMAYTIDFIIDPSSNDYTGSIRYYSSNGTIEGRTIDVDKVWLKSTNVTVDLEAYLTFDISVNTDMTFASGTISIKDSNNQLLMSGYINDGALESVASGTFQIVWAGIIDEKSEYLLDLLGLNSVSTTGWSGSLNLSWMGIEQANGDIYSTSVLSGDVNNNVPIPPSALLMGSGLVGLIGFGLRRRRSRMS